VIVAASIDGLSVEMAAQEPSEPVARVVQDTAVVRTGACQPSRRSSG
jgi:hypothetical protein